MMCTACTAIVLGADEDEPCPRCGTFTLVPTPPGQPVCAIATVNPFGGSGVNLPEVVIRGSCVNLTDGTVTVEEMRTVGQEGESTTVVDADVKGGDAGAFLQGNVKIVNGRFSDFKAVGIIYMPLPFGYPPKSKK
jgi:hypothetical protein